jgi:hypothetical protein
MDLGADEDEAGVRCRGAMDRQDAQPSGVERRGIGHDHGAPELPRRVHGGCELADARDEAHAGVVRKNRSKRRARRPVARRHHNRNCRLERHGERIVTSGGSVIR